MLEIKKIGWILIALCISVTTSLATETQPSASEYNHLDKKILWRISVFDSDRIKACADVESDFNRAESIGMSDVTLSPRVIMIRCGHDLSGLLKSDIKSKDSDRASKAVELWRLHPQDPHLLSGDIQGFIVNELTNAPSIKTWSNLEAEFPYYAAVTALIALGHMNELEEHLSVRSDVSDFQEFLHWHASVEKRRRPI